MLRLDVGTLGFTAAMTSMTCGMVYGAYGMARHHGRRWIAFGLSALCYGLGLSLIVNLGSFPPLFTVVGGNLLLALAAVALHACCAQLSERALPPVFYLAYVAAYLGGVSYFLYLDDSIGGRIVWASLIRVPLFLHAALMIHRHRQTERSIGLVVLETVLVGWACLLVGRPLAVSVVYPIREFLSLEGFLAFYYVMAGSAYVAMLIALMLIDVDRLAALLGREVSRQAEALETQISRQTQAQTELRSILDNMPDIFYRTDAQGRLLMLSRSVESLLGYKPEEVLGQDSAFFHGSDDSRPMLVAALEAAGGSILDYELRLRHKDGHTLWASTSSRFYYDAEGNRAGTEGVVRLIEERKQAEFHIRENQALIQAMLDASSDAIMLFRPDGTLLAVNGVMAARFGRKASELTGSCLWDMFPPSVAKAREVAVTRVVETGEAIHYLDRRGELYLDNSIYPVPGVDGVPDKVAVYSRDITAQTLAEQRLAIQMTELERSNAELEQFAYVASHDLREPLRMISSYLSLLERRYGPKLEGDGLEFLAFARDGAKRMDRLVLDLLDFSRIERKGSPIIAMEAEPVLRQALRHLAPSMDECGAQVEMAEDGGAVRVMGDPEQVIRLFQNLVGNAVKYRAPGRVPRVSVSWRRDGGEWECTIADNGIGIDPQYFERIFGIFQRLHTPDRYTGTGIGLAICKKIVERHSGRIWVDSTPGQGTAFHFTLPAAD
ncbi:Phytochrome two-component sensor histidine kinase Cyanobacterial phytochrome B [Paramagnetospirillum magnetotacticum MS-1]|uniref:histidine kinase n=1 Tax=Paramagnetospirillum magnetotacticum MS-1 TaxID=272627 RepID=A0A0C2YHN2_PARME|nr:ATP-binding protein [Paramagnetospirillum magnetotacticum]KIL99239.1 Phytochrome two-component sensor histidine kinase Cyanobacterial phytochrome B [Paramagnetospirillum magnetotacticum MS-1]